MHAVSEDLDNWEKVPEDTFYAPVGYDHCDFRDPFVYQGEEKDLFYMLLCARPDEMGNTLRKGQTIRMVSHDLKRWEFDKVIYAPNAFHTDECPDLFKIGDWWYLIFSEYSDRSLTCYRMAKSPEGPWLKPLNDNFDGRAFYAAKTATDGKNRYLFGWTPTRMDGKDKGNWMWGGNLVVHQLLQNKDGTLAVTLPKSLVNGEKGKKIGDLTIDAEYESKVVTLDSNKKTSYHLHFDADRKGESREFGILVNRNDKEDRAYQFKFDLGYKVLSFNRYPCFPQNDLNTYELHRPLESAKEYSVDLVADKDVFVVYVNNQVALSVRLYENFGDDLALYVDNGNFTFRNITLATK